MKVGLVRSVSAGLILALAVIAGVSAAGPRALHIDVNLATPSLGAAATSTPQVGSQSSGITPSPPSNGEPNSPGETLAGPSLPISSVNALTTEGSATLGLVALPIIVGITVSGLFYGIFTRRTEDDA